MRAGRSNLVSQRTSQIIGTVDHKEQQFHPQRERINVSRSLLKGHHQQISGPNLKLCCIKSREVGKTFLLKELHLQENKRSLPDS